MFGEAELIPSRTAYRKIVPSPPSFPVQETLPRMNRLTRRTRIRIALFARFPAHFSASQSDQWIPGYPPRCLWRGLCHGESHTALQWGAEPRVVAVWSFFLIATSLPMPFFAITCRGRKNGLPNSPDTPLLTGRKRRTMTPQASRSKSMAELSALAVASRQAKKALRVAGVGAALEAASRARALATIINEAPYLPRRTSGTPITEKDSQAVLSAYTAVSRVIPSANLSERTQVVCLATGVSPVTINKIIDKWFKEGLYYTTPTGTRGAASPTHPLHVPRPYLTSDASFLGSVIVDRLSLGQVTSIRQSQGLMCLQLGTETGLL